MQKGGSMNETPEEKQPDITEQMEDIKVLIAHMAISLSQISRQLYIANHKPKRKIKHRRGGAGTDEHIIDGHSGESGDNT